MSQVTDGMGLTADDVVANSRDVRGLEGHFRTGDWDALLGMCTDDIVFLPPGSRRWKAPVCEVGLTASP